MGVGGSPTWLGKVLNPSTGKIATRGGGEGKEDLTGEKGHGTPR